VKIFGTADTDEGVSKLYADARHWLQTNGSQLAIDFEDERGHECEETMRVVDNMDAVLLNGTQLLLGQVYEILRFFEVRMMSRHQFSVIRGI